MKPCDSFGVVVRVVGLLSFLIGVFWVCFKSLGLLEAHVAGAPEYTAYLTYRTGSYFGYFYAAVFIFIGYLLMRAADTIVKFLYPKDGE